MKTAYLSALLCAAVFFAYGANAQNPPAPQDTTKGNDLVGSPQPAPANPLSSPPTTGQDKSTGNDLVAPNQGQANATPQKRPDFDSLDTGKKGYLTAHNVKGHRWLSKNFKKCNVSHDGHLTRDEFNNCHK